MSHSIHHVPGRLRVRSTAFRCQPGAARAAQDRLATMEGVTQVRLSAHAGSLTIHYDPAHLSHTQLLSALSEMGCSETVPANPEFALRAGAMFGKALVGAMINKAVERSAYKVVSALL